MEEERRIFMKIFADLPEKIRREDIIVVLDGKPYTWNSAFIEVKNRTGQWKEILKRLKYLGVI